MVYDNLLKMHQGPLVTKILQIILPQKNVYFGLFIHVYRTYLLYYMPRYEMPLAKFPSLAAKMFTLNLFLEYADERLGNKG